MTMANRVRSSDFLRSAVSRVKTSNPTLSDINPPLEVDATELAAQNTATNKAAIPYDGFAV